MKQTKQNKIEPLQGVSDIPFMAGLWGSFISVQFQLKNVFKAEDENSPRVDGK